MKESFIAPTGRSIHKCGYCHSPGDSSISHGLWAFSMTPIGYQDLIDASWRRSGKYIYKPNMNTCCPAYTIRLHASQVQLSKSQKKTLRKMRKFVIDNVPNLDGMDGLERDLKDLDAPEPQLLSDSDLCNLINDAEGGKGAKHTLHVKMVPACFDQDSYDLYCKYQVQIHHDDPEKLSVKGYCGFLVDSPIFEESLSESFPGIPNYGSYHQKYYMDNVLIAVGVLDILPYCVSSVYFFYHPDYSFLSLGVYAALREIALTQSLKKVLPDLKYYYMGYYIHSCPKMRYKGDYRPSELLCPFSFKWVFLSDSITKLDKNPSSSLQGPEVEFVEPLPENVPDGAMDKIKVYYKQNLMYFKDISTRVSKDQISEIKLLIAVLKSLVYNYVIVLA